MFISKQGPVMKLPAGKEFQEELRTEAAELEERLNKIRRMISDLDDLLEDGQASQSDPAQNGTAPALRGSSLSPRAHATAGRTPKQPSRRSLGETRYDRIKKILKAAGESLRTKDIVDALIERGDKSPDSSARAFNNTVDSALRSGVERGFFRRDGKATWALVEGKEATK